MSFAGHVFDMINRTKQNEYLKKYRRARFRKLKDAYSAGIGIKKSELTKNKISKEELDVIKDKIRRKIRSDRKKRLIKTLLATLFVISIVILIVWKFSDKIIF